jgi:hypothetical protein
MRMLSVFRCLRIIAAVAVIVPAMQTTCAQELESGPVQEHEHYFYKGRDFGSEANYNPVSLLLNGSFDVIQLDGYSRRIGSYPYGKMAHQVVYNVTRPLGVISKYGWKDFIVNQVVPFDFTRRGAQWWPNYQLHLVGGGMTYVAMSEWYEEHGVPEPKLCSIATMAAYHFMNEAVETYTSDYAISGVPFPNVDPVADIYIFDAAGIVLFSFDCVNEFFSKTMNLADWSLQPSFAFAPFTLQNNGQYFSVKWRIPFLDHWHIFYITGMNGLLGLSYKKHDGSAISVGVGLRARQLVNVQTQNVQQTADLTWNAGVFYDMQNSLMASLLVSGLTNNVVTLNVYPGVFRIGSFSPGLWMAMNRDLGLMGGLVTRFCPGLAWK